jgi:hypothetical protein
MKNKHEIFVMRPTQINMLLIDLTHLTGKQLAYLDSVIKAVEIIHPIETELE